VADERAPRNLAELAEDLGDDGVALLSAATVDELRRRLLSTGPRRRSCVDAELLLRTHHQAAPGALDTARLLLTDRRWARLSATLVHGLIRTGLLSDDDLDALARELLDGEWLAYRVDNDGPGDDNQLVARRPIPPPLRRWAASRAIRRALLASSEVFALLGALPARATGEAVRGMVDELESLPADEADELLETALSWPARAARMAALDRLIERGDAERAARLAPLDPDRGVRDRVGRPATQESLF
jgi:hypothetical protein